MPQYGRFQFGRIAKYGKYLLSRGGEGNNGFKLGQHVRYRIRSITPDGKKSDFATMCEDRLVMPRALRTRMRAKGGEWIYPVTKTIPGEIGAVRIRSINEAGEEGEWVYGVKGELK